MQTGAFLEMRCLGHRVPGRGPTRSPRAVEWSPFRPRTFVEHVMWTGLRSQNWVCSPGGNLGIQRLLQHRAKGWLATPRATADSAARPACGWGPTGCPPTTCLDGPEEVGARCQKHKCPTCRCAPGPDVLVRGAALAGRALPGQMRGQACACVGPQECLWPSWSGSAGHLLSVCRGSGRAQVSARSTR